MVMLGLFLLGLFHFGSSWPSQKIYRLPDFEMCIDTDLKQIENLKRELFKIIPLEEITGDKKDTSFGLLNEDWDRLDKLAKNLPNDSIMKSRLVNAFRLLIAALYQVHSKPIFQECYGQSITTSKETYVKTTNNTNNISRNISKDRHDLDEEESFNWPPKTSITNQTVKKENYYIDNVVAGSDNEETGIVYSISSLSDSPSSFSTHNNDHTSSILHLSTDGNSFNSTTSHPFDVKLTHDEFSPGSVEFSDEDGTGSTSVSTLSFEEPYSTESYNSSLDLINIQNSTIFQILYGLENTTEHSFDGQTNETVDLNTTSKDFEYSTDAISLFSTAKSSAEVKVSHPPDENTPVNSVYQTTENPTSPYQNLSHYDITESESILVDKPTTSYPSYLFSTTTNTIDGTQNTGKEIHSDEESNVQINITEFSSTTPTLPEVIRTYSILPPSVENASGIDNANDENNQTMKTLTSEFTNENTTPNVFEITSPTETSQITKESFPISPNITTINTTNNFSHDYYTLSSTYQSSLISTSEIIPDQETSTSWTAKSEKTSLPDYFDNSLYDDDEDNNENKNPESRFGFDSFGPEKGLSTTAKPKESFKYFTITFKKQSQSHDGNKHTNKLKIYPKENYPIKRPQQEVYSSCTNGNHCVRVHDPQYQYPASFHKNDKVPNSDIYYNLPYHVMKRNKALRKRPPKDFEPSNGEGLQWSLNKLSKENTLK